MSSILYLELMPSWTATLITESAHARKRIRRMRLRCRLIQWVVHAALCAAFFIYWFSHSVQLGIHGARSAPWTIRVTSAVNLYSVPWQASGSCVGYSLIACISPANIQSCTDKPGLIQSFTLRTPTNDVPFGTKLLHCYHEFQYQNHQAFSWAKSVRIPRNLQIRNAVQVL